MFISLVSPRFTYNFLVVFFKINDDNYSKFRGLEGWPIDVWNQHKKQLSICVFGPLTQNCTVTKIQKYGFYKQHIIIKYFYSNYYLRKKLRLGGQRQKQTCKDE